MVTAGYFIPGRNALIQIQFLKEVSGYIWIFPRPDHVSAGIAAKMGEIPTARLRGIVEQWLSENGFLLDGARFYSHVLPALRTQTLNRLQVCGDGWAMIGDSAGLVDPITGEGLYYALRSAELCAKAVLANHPVQYTAQLEAEVISELRLAASVSHRFYRGEFMGQSVAERIVDLTRQSEHFRDLLRDLFAGIQGYRDLRSRLYHTLPSIMAEGMAGTLRPAWSGSSLATESK